MLQLRNIKYDIADTPLLKDINWIINPKRRIALIGPNGAGKTTLFRIINGLIPIQEGEIQKPKNYKIGYLPQEEITVGKGSILVEVLKGHQNVVDIEIQMHNIQLQLENVNLKDSEQETLVEKLGSLEHQYLILGGYEIESNAKKILQGLGFSESDFHKSHDKFSGGWRMRVHLARLLLQKPDLLLLDEPTNHLDLESLEWLENYLFDFQGSIVIISHDRFFVDRLSHEIAELEFCSLTHYSGNYHFYEKQKALRKEQLLQKAEEIRQERERLTRFIDRFRYKNTKAVQVQSRIKRLEKLQEIEIPREQSKYDFKIECPVKSYHDVCNIENLSFRYTSEWVLRGISIQLYRGEKAALVGVNGAGKTTFTKLIAGQLKPEAGTFQLGERVMTGYYAQHQVESLDLKKSVFEEVSESAATQYRTRIRDVLGVFQFSGDQVNKPIKVLSGGEKARVSLAKILISPVNFLIMDEPTNHLDLVSKEALENALLNYDGTLLLISHDRYFLDKLVSKVFELKNGTLSKYEGNYSDYLNKKLQRIKETENQIQQADVNKDTKISNRKEQKRSEAEARQKISAERKTILESIKKLEDLIEKLEEEKEAVEQLMLNPDFYKNDNKAAEIGKRYQELQKLLPVQYELWEKNNTELESLIASMNNS